MIIDSRDKCNKLETKIENIETKIEKKFKNAVNIFDYLNDRIVRLETKITKIKQKKNNKYHSYIYYNAKKYRCQNYINRENCLKEDTIRESGYDICFEFPEGKCPQLVEID